MRSFRSSSDDRGKRRKRRTRPSRRRRSSRSVSKRVERLVRLVRAAALAGVVGASGGKSHGASRKRSRRVVRGAERKSIENSCRSETRIIATNDVTDGMQNVCNFNIGYFIRGSSACARSSGTVRCFLVRRRALFTAAKGTEGGGVGSASRLVCPLDASADGAKLDQTTSSPEKPGRLGPSLDARLTLGNGDELAVTRVFGVDGNFVERGVESKVDFVHTLH